MTILPIGASAPVRFQSFPLSPHGLRVHAIGSLRIEHRGVAVQAIGAPKAGVNQALGLFAFLFDRAERGVDKDEVIELIWPDASVPVADMAFHRTLLGIRTSLRSRGLADGVEFRRGRYALAPGLIGWSDVIEIEHLVEKSASADAGDRIDLLEACRRLNAAEYLDDCPFYGSSSFVEARRVQCRAIRIAILMELAELYDAAGHRALAAMRHAEAATAELETAAFTRLSPALAL